PVSAPTEPAMTEPAQPLAAPPLRPALGATNYFTLTFGSIIGVGWVVVMHDWLGRGGPAGAILGFLLGALLVLPIAVVYGQLTAQLPQSDGEMAFTASLLPEWARFGV